MRRREGSASAAYVLTNTYYRLVMCCRGRAPERAGPWQASIDVYEGREHNDLVLWIENMRAVVAGDTLADFGEGPEINSRWLPTGVTREQVADGLRPLLALPVEHLLATHGGPFYRAALERALL